MRLSLPTYTACLVAALVLAWFTGTASAAATSAVVGDECLELVSTPTLECTRGSDDVGEALCEPADLMSLRVAESAGDTVGSDGSLTSALSTSGAEFATEAGTAHVADSGPGLETIRLCPPGTTPQDSSCRIRAPHDAPPGQGSGAPSPQLDPWLLHRIDSSGPVRGRPVAFAGPAPVVHPGYARVPDRPPRA